MIVSVHQPHYLPWSGYFDKIDSADTFVVLDSVQYEKNGWQNRNRIKTADGWMWLTVPVNHSFGVDIRHTALAANRKWPKKHRQAVRTNYAKAPFFSQYEAMLAEFWDRSWDNLSELNDVMLAAFLETLEIGTAIVTASELGDFPDDPNERLAEIVSSLGGTTYLAGAGSKAYLDEDVFGKRGIDVVFQDYSPVEHPQLYGDFIPGLAIIDMLFNCGPETMDYIRKGRRTEL